MIALHSRPVGRLDLLRRRADRDAEHATPLRFFGLTAFRAPGPCASCPEQVLALGCQKARRTKALYVDGSRVGLLSTERLEVGAWGRAHLLGRHSLGACAGQ